MRHIATKIAFLSLLFLLMAFGVNAEMSSTNYKIRWDTLSSGGDDSSGSASYELRDTVGNNAIGSGTSSTYEIRAGYRAGVFDRVITFDILPQDTGASTNATALSSTTVTVGSTAGFSVDDFVVIVQDQGTSQTTGIGQITGIDGGANQLTLDAITSDGALTIDGTDDFVYPLTASSVSLGTLSTSEVKTGVIGFNVSADVDNGYSVQVVEDGNLRLSGGGADINDVTDGAVTVGKEEYGGKSSDGSLAFGTADTAFTGSFQNLKTASDNTFDERSFVVLKAATDSAQAGGTYSHTLTFIVSGNY